jgi:hypothetical protein
MDIAASIWYNPGTYEELYDRKIESMKHASEHMFFTTINIAKSNGWVYEKNGIYRCYKSTVLNVLNPNGYGIELPVDTRSEFRKSFELLNRM